MSSSQSLSRSQPSNSTAIIVPSAHHHPHAQKLHDLQIFLNSAPALIHKEMQHLPPDEVREPRMKRFQLPSGDYISCVLWNSIFHITGTDVVRSLLFRFEVTGRPVRNIKKFEEGIFSDLRNLKPGTASVMEEAKSPFLDMLFRNQCIRTQKKQKVFYWFEVDHDRLYLDALDRDLKREKLGMEPTTGQLGKSSLSFDYDPRQSLSDQFIGPSSADGGGDGSLERTLRHLGTDTVPPQYDNAPVSIPPGTSTGVSMYGTPRVKMEQEEYPGRLGKRHGHGHPPLDDQIDNSRDQAQNYPVHLDNTGHQAYKRRRPNYDQDTDRSSSSTHLAPSGSNSFGVARIPSWRMDTSALADPMALQQQSTTDGEVRVVPHMRNDGGGSDPQLWGMHAAEQEQRLMCPVPICRQVYIGKQVMLKHMRTHNEQDWTSKSRSISAPSTALFTTHRLTRSSSAEAHVLRPQQGQHDPTFNFAVPQYPRTTDLATLSNPSTLYLAPPSTDSKALSANSSPSAATFPRTPQQQLSPTQTSLSIESAPTSILDEPHPYHSRHSTYPFATRGLFPGYSPGSNSSPEVPGAFTFERGQQPPTIVSAPPSRSTFQQQNGQSSQSWNLWPSQKEFALRRFRSATPTVGGTQQVPSPSARTAPIPHGPTPDDSLRSEAYQRPSPTSHLGLYASPHSNSGRLVGDLPAPAQNGYLASPATGLSASPLQGSPQDRSPASYGGAVPDESRTDNSSISSGHRTESHLPSDAYTVPTTSMLSAAGASNLSAPSLPETVPNANFNPDMSVPAQPTNMVHSYPGGPVSYTYTPNYSTYSSYAV